MRKWLAIAVPAIFLLCLSVTPAYPHGEAADEPFLKDLTVAFYNVHVSPTSIRVGDPVTLSGTLKILETWPYTLDPPETAYITPVVPGPVFVLVDRVVNGQPAFGSITVERGGTYNFKMVMKGRNPGRWHVHPGIAIQGTGTLIGPGEWVDIAPSATPFKMNVMLLNGRTVDLEHFGGSFVWWWSLAGFIVGLIWMIYWTVPKRTVTRLAVTSQLGVNDDAPDIGLITPDDHKWMNVLAGITIAMLVVGWVWMAAKYPVRLPQQTDRFAPAIETPSYHLAQVTPAGSPNNASYDEKTDTLTINLDVKNLGDSAITPKQYSMAMATFVNGSEQEQAGAGPHDFVGLLQVDPQEPIPPGETRRITLKMTSPLFDEERLIPLHDPQQLIAGLLGFSDNSGREEMVTVKSVLIPNEFQPQYLP
jgi:methane/ammonia monooxygenase subunit B